MRDVTARTYAERAANARLRRGQPLNPPRASPFHVLARSCLKCGALITTPPGRLRKTSGRMLQCPCDERRRQQLWRDRRKAKGLPPLPPWVVDAQNESLERATRRGAQWTGPELEIACRDDLSARKAAEMLGRTLYAVETARSLARKEPRKADLVGDRREPPTPS